MVLKTDRVLLIDDSLEMHCLIRQFLSVLDVELISAYGGQQGLQMAASERPTLVLLDYMMPHFDGMRVLEKLKADPELKSIPVIMITAENDRELISLAFDRGVCDYVNKPLYADEFRARVKTVLRNCSLLEDLTQKSRFDALTGLANKANLLERLENAITRSRSGSDPIAIMFIDLDRFKLINDSLGHAFGDIMLQMASKRLKENVRQTDVVARCDGHSLVARLGGDEFVILLDSIKSVGEAEAIARRLLKQLLAPYQVSGRTLYLGASIGVVTCEGQYKCGGDMIRDADIAMYEAKAAGRERYKVFNDSMRKKAHSRWELDIDLRRAISENQFHLVYQPIIDLKTGDVASVEALIRWNHPARGLVPPMDFIPMAEETGIIIEIGEWVTRTACQQFADWARTDRDTMPSCISVNVSRKQLVHPNFVSTVKDTLLTTGVQATSVHFEVTESEIMTDLAATVRVMNELRAIGIKFDMDDFGTGYSSLACLHQMPLDVVKLDRSLISTIDQDDYFLRLARHVLQLMSETKIKVVAEGIETLSQFQILQEFNCAFGQGYFFSKPMAGNKIQDFIRKQRVASQRPSSHDNSVAIPIVQFKPAIAVTTNNATA